MSQQWRNYPSILQTLGNHQPSPEHHEEHSPQGYRHVTTPHTTRLVFTSSDDESPVRPSECHCQHSSTNARSSVLQESRPFISKASCNQHLCHYSTPTPNTEQSSTYFNGITWDDDITSFEENFPMAPLDDKVWSEDPISR